jgi:flagellar basal-body rod protein FlgC
MGLFNVLDVSRAGLAVEQTRLNVAASNLANARTTGTGAEGYQPLHVVAHSVIPEGGQLPIPSVVAIEPQAVEPELVFDPGHPDADAKGFVHRPGVDSVASMVDLVSISRGYEANLRVFDITRALLQRLLTVGGR